MKSLEDFLPYSSHITSEIVKIKGGSYLLCFELKGLSYLGKSTEEIDSQIQSINNFIMRMRAPTRYNLYLHTHCLRDYDFTTLEQHFTQDFARDLEHAYHVANFSAPTYTSTYYISVIYRPYRRVGGKSLVDLSVNSIQKLAQQAEEELENIKADVLSTFDDYQIRALGCYERNGVVFSEVLQFLSRLVNFDNSPVPIQRATIDQYLGQATVSIGNNDLIEISQKGFKSYACMISIFEYPPYTSSGCLQEVMEVDCKAIISQVFVPLDKTDAMSWLKREQKRMIASDDVSEQEINDMSQALEGVSADNFVLGDYYWQCTLIHPDAEQLREKAAQVISTLSARGFNASVNKIAKLDSYLSNFPANITRFPRTARIASENVAQLMPFLVQFTGKKIRQSMG